MGSKVKPGAFDCYDNAAPDEPMFILLARDRGAPALVRRWADGRERQGEDPAKVAEARQCARDMEDWRRDNRPHDVREDYVCRGQNGECICRCGVRLHLGHDHTGSCPVPPEFRTAPEIAE